MSTHLSDEQIRRLLGGTLPEDELAHAEAHLWQCPDCRDALRQRTEPTTDLPPLAAQRSEGAARLNALPAVPGYEVLGATKDGESPASLGRYRITGKVGSGGFGVVYKGYDDDLRRDVAIKVPHRERIATPEDAETYLAEARILASLDHPHIVPVYALGRTEDGLCFVVAKFIQGTDLAQKLKDTRLSLGESAELAATIADALHHAHKRGLVHRDVKPGNILLDTEGRPYLADFGLALKEEDYGKGAGLCGTPAYMSPEQANGEGHRVDGRSDIFSLGSVFYELLIGRLPFPGETPTDMLIRISSDEPRPPRQVADIIPPELERICLKALAKKASERYTTAKDLADDLRHFLDHAPGTGKATIARSEGGTALAPSRPAPRATSDYGTIKVVPKGLRSFDEHDADFFLELLPGPRDRDGLPDSIRFWKTRIEETDPDRTFAVGLIYGPSGCGKSSLVKAGLLPRLSENTIAVYVEATAAETEMRLLHQVRKRCPALPEGLGLKETLAALRRGHGSACGKKVLIVLDQFEQWLHANKEEAHLELVQALRQCAGGRLQCIVMVRDDFWMAATRFMRELEVRLLEGQNSAAVDLFPMRHAEKVLAAFGRAFGVLPENAKETSKGQNEFLKQCIHGLANEGKVICVRLALLAEMMKGKAWTPATLKEVGGAEGVGVTFLEETFSAATAPPEHRYRQGAARAALHALLPEAGSDIKGHMRSYAELLEASGYGNRPRDFEDLIRILDNEIRLITPTDSEGKEEDMLARRASEGNPEPSLARRANAGSRNYQLTHDYLVPALWEWLTRKQKETRRGRAELRLADRAAQWQAKPENRHLPAWWEWANIRLFTRKQNWTPPQRKMMRSAACYHGQRGAALALLLAVATLAGLTLRRQLVEQRNATYAAGLVQAVLNADTAQVPAMIDGMAEYRQWTDPLLREAYDQAADKSSQKLHASLGLLPVDPGQVNYLYDRLLDAEPLEVPVIRHALAPHKDDLIKRLWTVMEKPEKGIEQQRLRAACALASYDVPNSAQETARWQHVSTVIVDELLAAVQKNPSHYATLLDQLRPVRASLLLPLTELYRTKEKPEAERSFATTILADYAADKPEVLSDLLMDGDEKQFGVVFPRLREHGEKALALLTGEIDKIPPAQLPTSDEKRETLAKRQANAAVALLKLNQSKKVWPLLQRNPPDDPRVRSYLIHRLNPLGADAGAVIKRLEEEPDVTIRRALVLSLGEFSEEQLPADGRSSLLRRLKEVYGTETDPGLHAAVEWLLRQWKQADWLNQVNEEWAKNEKGRNQRIEAIQQQLQANRAASAPGAPPQWYVNSQGQTMVVIPGPVEFVMGSPPTEDGRLAYESQHTRRIERTFAVAAAPVTVRQFRQFLKDSKLQAWFEEGDQTAPLMKKYSPDENGPIILVDWYHAAAYCNWLSKMEGVPKDQWCYETSAQQLSQAKVGVCVSLLLPQNPLARAASTSHFYSLLAEQPQVRALKKGYLSLRGYRLPTEAEMEYACRAGAVTSRYYGETEELLVNYGWYQKNSQERTCPPGRKKPNDLGFFDMQGNVFNWCQESFQGDYSILKGSKALEDKEDSLQILSTTCRMFRGGSFGNRAVDVRSAYRPRSGPSNRDVHIGVRPARTLPLGSFSP
jgi:serine/threonine protein kinase/formylglycine-generating enzyme required for sulfatase activity